MTPFDQAESARNEYGLKAWLKLLYIVLGMLFLVLGSILSPVLISPGRDRTFSLMMTPLFVAFGVFMLAQVLRARLVIQGTQIEVRNAFRERVANLGEIEGFRTISTRNGSYTQLCLKDGRGTISIPNTFDTDEAYREWLHRVPDLDQRDRQALLDEISQQADLGATPEERLGALATAKTWGIFTLVVSVVAAVTLNFADESLHLISALVLILMPLVVIMLVWRSPLLYAVSKPKADPRAELGFVLIVAAFGLFIRNRGVHLVSLQPLLWIMGLITVAYIAGFWGSIRANRSVWGNLVGVLFFAGLYSYGFVVLANTLTDQSQATRYTASVIGKHTSSGRSTSYILELSPWGPIANSNQLSVSSTLYYKTTVGDQVCLDLHSGSLNAPWYRHVSCNSLADSNQSQ